MAARVVPFAHPRSPVPGLAPVADEPAVHLLGGFSYVVGGAVIPLPRPAQRVVAYLALCGDTDRALLAGTLWADSAEDKARASLRTALWRITRAAPRLVAARAGQRLRLDAEVGVDVDAVRAAAWTAIDTPTLPPDVETSAVVAALGHGELLPGWYDAWLDDVRQDLHLLRLRALESLSEALVREGRYALALQCALRVSRMDPLRETAAASVIKVHLAERNVSEAVRFFNEFADRLFDDLAVRPSPQLRSLVTLAALGAEEPRR